LKKSKGLNWKQEILKRIFDLIFSLVGIVLLIIPVLVLTLFATVSTRKFGLFTQHRVGRNARIFSMFKIRTMKGNDEGISIACLNNDRMTSFGRFLRDFNLDELPQLINVLMGNMSMVGPRPDVVGYADKLVGEDKIILSIRPGITGPATLKYKNEEELLSNQKNPKEYNDEIIWKQKVEINKQYIENWSLLYDIRYIIQTILK